MKRRNLAAMSFVAVMIGWAASARAVDGTIEINQAKILAGTGFPFAISTANTSYRLTGSLAVPASTNGINVTVSNVTIDLNGFSITGPCCHGPIGINASGQNDATVENGTVTGFGLGVQVGTFGIVRNVHADKNGFGIQGGNNTVVEGCTANNSTFGSVGGAISCSGACAISANTVNGNPEIGIYCTGNGCVISGNTANNNASGIECGGSGCLISGNTADNNLINGLFLSDGTSGYGANVLNGNPTNVSNGTSMGNNVCGSGISGTVC
jgi:parallel beta-helix repeat protein